MEPSRRRSLSPRRPLIDRMARPLGGRDLAWGMIEGTCHGTRGNDLRHDRLGWCDRRRWRGREFLRLRGRYQCRYGSRRFHLSYHGRGSTHPLRDIPAPAPPASDCAAPSGRLRLQKTRRHAQIDASCHRSPAASPAHRPGPVAPCSRIVHRHHDVRIFFDDAVDAIQPASRRSSVRAQQHQHLPRRLAEGVLQRLAPASAHISRLVQRVSRR